MAFAISDRALWLGVAVSIYGLVRGISYGLRRVYDLTEVTAPRSPRAIAQATEEARASRKDMPLQSLQVLATQHPNLDIRWAASTIVIMRAVSDSSSIRCIVEESRRPRGTPGQRTAHHALQLIREWTQRNDEQQQQHHHGVDFVDFEFAYTDDDAEPHFRRQPAGPFMAPGWNRSLARTMRDMERGAARRRARREAVVISEGGRPISHHDIIQRPFPTLRDY